MHFRDLLSPDYWYIFLIYIKQEGSVETAKIFWSGRSQAVRLPKDFRFESAEVRIRRHGNAVILEPIADDWKWLDQVVGPVDEDFVQAVNEQPAEQDRPELDFFK
ncbi:AbrB family transcriptional regulator [Cupriavidus sp. HPC(L)]|nr:AbrB family transcriptional regulator [Cupriavidus sp. HPC(L)]